MKRNILKYIFVSIIIIFYVLYLSMVNDYYYKNYLEYFSINKKERTRKDFGYSIKYGETNENSNTEVINKNFPPSSEVNTSVYIVVKDIINNVSSIENENFDLSYLYTAVNIKTVQSDESTRELNEVIYDETSSSSLQTTDESTTTKAVEVIDDSIGIINKSIESKLSIYDGLSESFNISLRNSSETPSESIDCPPYPPNLIGGISVVEYPVPNISELESELSWVQSGGHYSPPCRQIQSTAIIIPYRDRKSQLMLFLKNMHPFLRKQQLNYTVYVIDQSDTLPFNRGELMNIGYVEALKEYNYTCFIFHDVDLFPEDDRIIYNCTDLPRHLISGLDKWEYKLLYEDLFGGAVSINTSLYKQLNGFSNRFWGWGGEDDDLRSRLRYHNISVVRYPEEIGRFKMLKHVNQIPNPIKSDILNNNTRYFHKDGLTTLDYVVKSRIKYFLYTQIIVELKENNIFKRKK